jgi:hypothetical protein
VTEKFRPGQVVRTSRADPPHHTRVPRYARGAVGTVVEVQGSHPLPDDSARGLPTTCEPVYAVSFPARELFGEGQHLVTVDIWESRLHPVAIADDAQPQPGKPEPDPIEPEGGRR